MSVSIFLSTVTDEFRDYRDQLRGDLTRHDVEVKVQEDFKDNGEVLLEKLDLYIRHCSIVVHLVGDMTGFAATQVSTTAIRNAYPDIATKLPPLGEILARGEAISYTQWEAWLALYHGKPLLIALAGEAAPRGPRFAAPDATRAAQAAHLARLKQLERYPGVTFTSPDNLAKQIALSRLLDVLAEDRARGTGLTTDISIGGVVGAIAILIGTPVIADQWARTAGVTLAAPIVFAAACAALVMLLVYSRYVALLGAGQGKPGTAERSGYDMLRLSLSVGGFATQLYTRWLTVALDRVDRFFGDHGKGERSPAARLFGLKTPARLWTAPAYDQCLLLALIYPIVTIYVFWAVSGHVGLAEAVLQLPSELPSWRRGTTLGAFLLIPFALWKAAKAEGKLSGMWVAAVLASLVGLISAVGLGRAVVVTLGLVYGVGIGTFLAGAMKGTGVGAAIVGAAVAGSFAAVADSVWFNFGAGATAIILIWAVDKFRSVLRSREWHLSFLLCFTALAITACLAASSGLSSSPDWLFIAPMLLFLGLLTLLNAPFDWLSLGLTRGLLRRGLELGGWWPLLLALVDALLAAIIIVALALTMIVGVQLFDALAVRGGGKAILPLLPLLDGIAARPADPEYWWVYALLLSTMIPSLLNLGLGGTAMLRGIPGLSGWLVRFMPANGAVPVHDRAWIAIVLTLQVMIGIALGILVQAALAWLLFVVVLPNAGLGLLDMSRAVVTFDLPGRVIAWWVGA